MIVSTGVGSPLGDLSSYADGVDFECFRLSGCTKACCGTTHAVSEVFSYLQREINAVLSASGEKVFVRIDGKIGVETMRGLVATSKYVAGISSYDQAVGTQDYRILAENAKEISEYLATRASAIAQQRGSRVVTSPAASSPNLPRPGDYPHSGGVPGPVPRPNGMVSPARASSKTALIAAGIIGAAALVGGGLYYYRTR